MRPYEVLLRWQVPTFPPLLLLRALAHCTERLINALEALGFRWRKAGRHVSGFQKASTRLSKSCPVLAKLACGELSHARKQIRR